MKYSNISMMVFACAVLMACGGGGGSVNSEVVRVDDTTDDTPDNNDGSGDTPTDGGDSGGDTPVDGGTDEPDVAEPTLPAPEDVESTNDLVLAPTVELKTTFDVDFTVDLSEAYDGAVAVLCISETPVPSDPTPASLSFDNCVFDALLENGQLATTVSLANTADYLFSAVISASAPDQVVSWQNVSSGQQLLVSL